MATPQTQFYKGILTYAGGQIPTLPGARITCPRNWAVPPIIGNYWQFNYAEGLRQPMVDVQLVVRGNTSEALSLSFLNLFHTRSNDAAHDTSALAGGINFWDGRTGWNLGGAKADSYSISCQKGDDIRFSARFVGTSITALGGAPSFTPWDTSPIYRFQKVAFAGALANVCWRFDLSYSNNHNPNLSLDGTSFPTDQNAGMMTAGFNVMVQAADTSVDTISAAAIQIGNTAAGDAIQRTFTLNNLINNTDSNRGIDAPRVMRQHSFICLGGSSQGVPPITLS